MFNILNMVRFLLSTLYKPRRNITFPIFSLTMGLGPKYILFCQVSRVWHGSCFIIVWEEGLLKAGCGYMRVLQEEVTKCGP